MDRSVTMQAAGGQLAYVAPALVQARTNFFGADGGTGGGSAAGGGGLSGGYGLDEPVDLDGAAAMRTTVTVSRRDDPAPGLVLRSTVALSHASAGATLPEGMGVLTDPMRARIWADTVAGQVTLGRSVALGCCGILDYAAGVGVEHGVAQAHLQSALIDLKSRVVLTQPYFVLTGNHGLGHGLNLSGEVLLREVGGAEYRLGLAQSF